MSQFNTLEKFYGQVPKSISKQKSPKYNNVLTDSVDTLIKEIDKNKSLVSALITSCVKKISNPDQDIRYHRTDFENGYSARVLDTKVTAPFFKKYFPKYANKESAFLTLATREKIAWTKEAGDALKIRNKDVKAAFLEILDLVENRKIKPQDVIVYTFTKLYELSLHQETIFDDAVETSDFVDIININTVLEMLDKHFATKLSSRLPVIAIYSVYEQLFKQINRYSGKILRPLNVHTSSDKHGYGDVEVWNHDNTPFEMVEVKHNIPIERNLIFDIVKKSEGTSIKRYYILTTAKNNFVSEEEEKYINKFILKIRNDTGLDVIANGIRYSLKYYLRFIDDCKKFIKTYTKNLVNDAKNSTEVQEFHIATWRDILKEHQLGKEENLYNEIIGM
jgi:DNA (cytosine-5)-methyltransferase 1